MMSDFDPSQYVTIPNGWSCRRLVDCTVDGNISYGIVQPGQHDENGIPVIRINNINNGQLDLLDVLKVSPEIENKYERTRLKGGEVLLTLVGSTGQSFVAPDELAGWNVPRAIAVIRANEEVGADWVNICLQSIEAKHFLNVRANTTVQKTLNLKDVRDIPILIPPPVIKKSIEAMVISLSKKMELNRQTNQTLEQIAQAIFKSWFVDFDPVKAKLAAKQAGANPEQIERAAMCAISGKTDAELDELINLHDVQGSINVAGAGSAGATLNQLKTTAAFFPDALVDSELGEIPEGWDVSSLGEHFNVVMGQSPKGDTYNEDGIGTVFFQGRRDFGFRYPMPRVYTTDPKRFAQKGDTLISVRAPVGDKNMAVDECCLGRGVASIRHKSGSRSFTYSFISHIESNLSNSGSDGTVFNSINKNELSSIPFVSPDVALISAFETLIYPLDQCIAITTNEIISLVILRDTLLPNLLSGDIEIKTTQNKLGRLG